MNNQQNALYTTLQHESEIKHMRETISALEARCAGLAAEIAGLKAVIAENRNMRDVLRQLVSARPGGVYFNKWEHVILKTLNEIPSTGKGE